MEEEKPIAIPPRARGQNPRNDFATLSQAQTMAQQARADAFRELLRLEREMFDELSKANGRLAKAVDDTRTAYLLLIDDLNEHRRLYHTFGGRLVRIHRWWLVLKTRWMWSRAERREKRALAAANEP